MRPRFRLHVFEESATSFGFKKLASTLPVHKGIHSFDFCGTATAHIRSDLAWFGLSVPDRHEGLVVGLRPT
jgi:hypothetical protein